MRTDDDDVTDEDSDNDNSNGRIIGKHVQSLDNLCDCLWIT